MTKLLAEYIYSFAKRGACTCGRCCDALENPEEKQPKGHTSDVHFFKVSAQPGATKENLQYLVERECPCLLEHGEHNYIEIGGLVGDQGLGLMLMGLGDLLGLWELLTPRKLLPNLPKELQDQMAGSGFVAIRSGPKPNLEPIKEAVSTE